MAAVYAHHGCQLRPDRLPSCSSSHIFCRDSGCGCPDDPLGTVPLSCWPVRRESVDPAGSAENGLCRVIARQIITSGLPINRELAGTSDTGPTNPAIDGTHPEVNSWTRK